LKEDQDEEDAETIERVIWYQPKGVAEDALRNDRSTQPTVMSMPSDFDLQWDDVEFYIKWKGQSYLHCQWKTLSELRSVRAYLDIFFSSHVLLVIFVVFAFISLACFLDLRSHYLVNDRLVDLKRF
jgi:hypothetical protein